MSATEADRDRSSRPGTARAVSTPKEREALLEALRQEAAAYEGFVAEHGSFAEAVDTWLEENPD